MDHTEFDTALVASAMKIAADRGWSAVSVAEAAREAGLPLDRARRRFPVRAVVLARLGSMADQEALRAPVAGSTPRDKLFDLLMRRFDAFQRHRAGVLTVLRHLPCDPLLVVALKLALLGSMGWMLEAAGLSAHGMRGRLRRQGLAAVWLYAMNAWRKDSSEDLSTTMSALDRALSRAEQCAEWINRRPGSAATPATPEPPATPETPPVAPPV
jgi:AcrR family transcriptional regulator